MLMETFYWTFLYINYILLSLNVIVGLMNFKRLTNKERIYLYYISFLFLIEFVSFVVPKVMVIKDMSSLYLVYISGEFLLLSTLFFKKLHLSKIFSVIAVALVAIFLGISYFPNIGFNPDLAKVISNIIIICLASTYLLRQIKTGKEIDRFVLVDAGIFFYYSVSVLIFVVQSQLPNLSEESLYLVLGINTVLAALLYSTLLYRFLKLKK